MLVDCLLVLNSSVDKVPRKVTGSEINKKLASKVNIGESVSNDGTNLCLCGTPAISYSFI